MRDAWLAGLFIFTGIFVKATQFRGWTQVLKYYNSILYVWLRPIFCTGYSRI